jgi:hypothetical protein
VRSLKQPLVALVRSPVEECLPYQNPLVYRLGWGVSVVDWEIGGSG